MTALIYVVFGALALAIILLLILNEGRKRRRFNRLMDLRVDLKFKENADPYDHMRRGSIILHLHSCQSNVKGIVVKKIRFTNRAFHVPPLDNLYFNGKSSEHTLLSASFRVRRHALRRMAGKKIWIYLSGWVSDNQGYEKPYKAYVPYTVQYETNETLTMPNLTL